MENISILALVLMLAIVMEFILAGPGTRMMGAQTGITTVSLTPRLDVTFEGTSTVTFGTIQPAGINTTEDNNPLPLVLRNDGNAKTNVTISTNGLWQTGGVPSQYFQFKTSENETGSVMGPGDLVSTWTDIPPLAFPVKAVGNLKHHDSNDEVRVDIRIEVPPAEPAGQPNSAQLFFTASLA